MTTEAKKKLRYDRLLRLISGIMFAGLAGYYSWGYFEHPLGNIITTIACTIVGSVFGAYMGFLLEFITWSYESITEWLFEPKR